MSPRISSARGPFTLLNQAPWTDFDCAIIEAVDEFHFLRPGDADFDGALAVSVRGVAFGPSSELRWLLRADFTFHLVYISDDGTPLPGANETCDLRPIPDNDGGPSQILLWGTRASLDCFLEGRIPGPIRYPVDIATVPVGDRCAVRVRHYTLEVDTLEWRPSGVVTIRRPIPMFRCVKLEPARIPR